MDLTFGIPVDCSLQQDRKTHFWSSNFVIHTAKFGIAALCECTSALGCSAFASDMPWKSKNLRVPSKPPGKLCIPVLARIHSYDSSASLKTMTMCDQEPLQPFTSRRVARFPPSPSWGLRSSEILSDPALTCFERIQKPIQIRNISKL